MVEPNARRPNYNAARCRGASPYTSYSPLSVLLGLRPWSSLVRREQEQGERVSDIEDDVEVSLCTAHTDWYLDTGHCTIFTAHYRLWPAAP